MGQPGTSVCISSRLASRGATTTYPDAGHSFADYVPLQPISRIMGFGQNDGAADDAWKRVFAFFGEHLRVT
jgi:dienelactone hydrolase